MAQQDAKDGFIKRKKDALNLYTNKNVQGAIETFESLPFDMKVWINENPNDSDIIFHYNLLQNVFKNLASICIVKNKDVVKGISYANQIIKIFEKTKQCNKHYVYALFALLQYGEHPLGVKFDLFKTIMKCDDTWRSTKITNDTIDKMETLIMSNNNNTDPEDEKKDTLYFATYKLSRKMSICGQFIQLLVTSKINDTFIRNIQFQIDSASDCLVLAKGDVEDAGKIYSGKLYNRIGGLGGGILALLSTFEFEATAVTGEKVLFEDNYTHVTDCDHSLLGGEVLDYIFYLINKKKRSIMCDNKKHDAFNLGTKEFESNALVSYEDAFKAAFANAREDAKQMLREKMKKERQQQQHQQQGKRRQTTILETMNRPVGGWKYIDGPDAIDKRYKAADADMRKNAMKVEIINTNEAAQTSKSTELSPAAVSVR